MTFTIYRARMHEDHRKVEECDWEVLIVVHSDKTNTAREMAISFAKNGYTYDHVDEHVHCIYGYSNDSDPNDVMHVIHIYDDNEGNPYNSDFDVYSYHYISIAITVIGDIKKQRVWYYFPQAERPDGKREMIKQFSEFLNTTIDSVYVWDMCTGQRGYVEFTSEEVQYPDINTFLKGGFPTEIKQPWSEIDEQNTL